MNEKLISESARANLYYKKVADLRSRVLSMQESAVKGQCDPQEVDLIATAYAPFTEYLLKIIYEEEGNINDAVAVLNRFTSTLTFELVAAIAVLQEVKGTPTTSHSILPVVQTIIDDYAGRINHNLNTLITPKH